MLTDEARLAKNRQTAETLGVCYYRHIYRSYNGYYIRLQSEISGFDPLAVCQWKVIYAGA